MTHIIFAPNCASIRNLVIEIDFKKNDLLIVYHSKPENIRCRWVSDFLSFCKALTFLLFFARKAAQKFSLQRYKEYRSFYKTAKMEEFFCAFLSQIRVNPSNRSLLMHYIAGPVCFKALYICNFNSEIQLCPVDCCKFQLSPFILELNLSNLRFSIQIVKSIRNLQSLVPGQKHNG